MEAQRRGEGEKPSVRAPGAALLVGVCRGNFILEGMEYWAIVNLLWADCTPGNALTALFAAGRVKSVSSPEALASSQLLFAVPDSKKSISANEECNKLDWYPHDLQSSVGGMRCRP